MFCVGSFVTEIPHISFLAHKSFRKNTTSIWRFTKGTFTSVTAHLLDSKDAKLLLQYKLLLCEGLSYCNIICYLLNSVEWVKVFVVLDREINTNCV